MKTPSAMQQADIDRLSDEQIHALERATQKLANETQRAASRYQRTADRLRKNIKRRRESK